MKYEVSGADKEATDEVVIDLFDGTKELDLPQTFVPLFMPVQQALGRNLGRAV